MNTLKEAIVEMVQPFKETWMNMMIDYSDKHYDTIQIMYPEKVSELKRMKKVLEHFGKRINGFSINGKYYRFRYEDTIYGKLTKAWRGERYWNVTRETSHLRYNAIEKFINANCVEFKTPKAEWMDKVKHDLKYEWVRCIDKLVDKCEKKDVDVEAIKITLRPVVTSHGFEVAFTDGKDREIYARMIWAAEHSELVCPHIRYIVTSKKIK